MIDTLLQLIGDKTMKYELHPDISAGEFAIALRRAGYRIVNRPGDGAEIRRGDPLVVTFTSRAHREALEKMAEAMTPGALAIMADGSIHKLTGRIDDPTGGRWRAIHE